MLGSYYDAGDPILQCQKCGANMWYHERKRKRKNRHAGNLKFSMCYGDGKIQLPLLNQPPKVLQDLMFGNENNESKQFQQQIRT